MFDGHSLKKEHNAEGGEDALRDCSRKLIINRMRVHSSKFFEHSAANHCNVSSGCYDQTQLKESDDVFADILIRRAQTAATRSCAAKF